MKTEVHFLLTLLRHQLHQSIPTLPTVCTSLCEEELLRISTFHAVRPILGTVFQQHPDFFSESFKESIMDFTQQQRMLQLKIQQVSNELENIFAKRNIPFISFKGQSIERLLYPPHLPRESGDIDFLFTLADIPLVLSMLDNNGYKPMIHQPSPFRQINTKKIIGYMLQSPYQYEMSVHKKEIVIDIHWHAYPPQLPIQLNDNQLINKKPSPEDFTFWTLLIHHGAKDNWLKLKPLMDFSLWMYRFADTTNWEEKQKQINEYKLNHSFSIGLYLIQKHVDYDVPRVLSNYLFPIDLLEIENIEHRWSEAKSDKKRGGRLRTIQKWVGKQRRVSHKIIHIYHGISAFSEPNLGEYPRILTFPPTFVFLNLLCKAITYLVIKPLESWLNKIKKRLVTNPQT